jgi:DNA-binding transcriptional LysR family regulator
MDTRELSRIDLNLLISLNVLLEEKSVSRAAERLFITQPAMSKTLGRLREVFADPLFTRSSHGMQPTPRALELASALESVLHQIQQLVSGQHFDPATWQGELTIALSEYVGIWLLPPLMARLQLHAPGITLKSITRVEHQLQQLASGEVDIAIQIKHSHYGEEFICRDLGGGPPVVLARQGHPLTGKTMNWESFSRYPVIRIYISDQEELEVTQNMQSIIRRLEAEAVPGGGFETSHLLTALEVLRNTDYLMPAPPFLLGNPSAAFDIQVLTMPGQLDYNIDYMQVRHCRTENSPVHNWLWQQISEVLDELKDMA